ncbi:MAG: N-acetylneuraminate lyase [Lachnospirales bacterium]
MKGIFSALLTTFDKDGEINEAGLRQLVRHNIDNMKVDGLYVGGSTGEIFLVSFEEKKKIFEIVKDEAKDAIKLIAHVGSINLTEAKELGKYATELGYNCLSAVTPFYYKFKFEEIKTYYNEIIEYTGNDMIVYSIPVLTGTSMTISQFEELFENKKIIGIKYTSGDMYTLERLRKKFPNHLLYNGFDECLLSASVLNVDGAIGSTFNLTAPMAQEILYLIADGNVKKALEKQSLLNCFIEESVSNDLYQTLKYILSIKGIDAGYCKKPFTKLNDIGIERAEEISRKYL